VESEFLHFTFGNAVTILSFFVGMVVFAYTIKGDVKAQFHRLGSIETELTELRKIVVALARQEERLTAMDQRMLVQGQRIDAQAIHITAIDQTLLKLMEHK